MTSRLKKLAKQIPANAAAMEVMVRETIAAQLESETLIAERDKKLAEAAQPYAARISECQNTMARNLELLEAYSESHRADFGEAKSIVVDGHRMGWRLGNWKTGLLGKTKWADVVATLKAWRKDATAPKAQRGAFLRWMRFKMEPDKESMIADRADDDMAPLLKQAGVEIVQEETFYLAPDREGQDPALMTAQA